MAAVLSLVTVIALTPTDLPEAVLAALIIHAVSHIMKVAEMREFYRLKRPEFWLAIATLVAVITLDVLPALIIGVVFSIAVLVYRAGRPRVSMLGADPAHPGAFEDLSSATPTPRLRPGWGSFGPMHRCFTPTRSGSGTRSNQRSPPRTARCMRWSWTLMPMTTST